MFVLSSRFEGFPLVLIEALASGLAPVSFECKNGPKQMMGDSRLRDFLVEPYNINSYAEKLIQLIENKELRKSVSAEALKVSKRYQIDHVMKKWVELFNNLKKK
ncbi:glycosyltransferase [Riemerella anatipestifer]|nr:glycosyltransferase [Riemerella anatipestifer]